MSQIETLLNQQSSVLYTYDIFTLVLVCIIILIIISSYFIYKHNEGNDFVGVLPFFALVLLAFLSLTYLVLENFQKIPSYYFLYSSYQKDTHSCIGEKSNAVCLVSSSTLSRYQKYTLKVGSSLQEKLSNLEDKKGHISFRIISMKNIKGQNLLFIKTWDDTIIAVDSHVLYGLDGTRKMSEDIQMHKQKMNSSISEQEVKAGFNNSNL